MDNQDLDPPISTEEGRAAIETILGKPWLYPDPLEDAAPNDLIASSDDGKFNPQKRRSRKQAELDEENARASIRRKMVALVQARREGKSGLREEVSASAASLDNRGEKVGSALGKARNARRAGATAGKVKIDGNQAVSHRFLDAGQLAISRLVDEVLPKGSPDRELIELQHEEMRQDLYRNASSVVGRLAVDRVLICWQVTRVLDALVDRTQLESEKFAKVQRVAEGRLQTAIRTFLLVKNVEIHARSVRQGLRRER